MSPVTCRLQGGGAGAARPVAIPSPPEPNHSSRFSHGELRGAARAAGGRGGVRPPRATAQKLGRYGQFETVGTKTPRNIFLLSLDANHFLHPFRRTMWNNSVST